MESAMELARESFLKDEVPVGAVVVKENIIIGRGRNTVIADNDVSSHAEINALRSASKELNNFRVNIMKNINNDKKFTNKNVCY